MSIGQILFGFEGRLNRARWWVFTLLALAGFVVVQVVLVVLAQVLAPTPSGLLAFALIGYPPFVWVSVALGVKRLHDRNKSGALLLVYYLLPFLLSVLILYLTVGLAGLAVVLNPTATPTASTVSAIGSRTFVILVLQLASFVISIWSLVDLGFLDGTPGWNRFGPDPTSKTYTVHG